MYGEQVAIIVYGGRKVHGEIEIQGSKNAVLPIIAASVLCQGKVCIKNCPEISDVYAMAEVITSLGGEISFENHCLSLDTENMQIGSLPKDCVGEIRASILFLGSLLGRFGEATISYPGGCSIGERPIDFHLMAFRQMGTEILEDDKLHCRAPGGVKAANISLPFPSVGATENILLAAVKAKGITIIENAAKEPEIIELCCFLRKMGADITGEGTECIIVCGVEQLYGVSWEMNSDRIVFLTYSLLVAGCGGKAFLKMKNPSSCREINILKKLGCLVEIKSGGIVVTQEGIPQSVPYISTGPYPAFPTDAQSPVMAVLCKGNGISVMEENIFENRLGIVKYLRDMGANIDSVSNRACIAGVTKLHGAKVDAEDLRSGAGLLIAAAMAEGRSEISGEHFIKRGYDNVIEHMQALGLHVCTNGG